MTIVTFSKTITLRPNGSMTLPKKLRSKYRTMHYIAEQAPQGILLKPVEDIEYWEKPDGSCGLHFPYGIEAGELADRFEKTILKLEKEERSKKSKKPSRRRNRG